MSRIFFARIAKYSGSVAKVNKEMVNIFFNPA
jgi:hypothetical protein